MFFVAYAKLQNSGRPASSMSRAVIPPLAAALLAVMLAGCQPDPAAEHRAMVGLFCLECHDRLAQEGGLVLQARNFSEIGQEPELWENVIHKLRGRMMPPADQAQPELEQIDSFIAYLEASLDAAAVERPNPGRKTVHRLSRTEYGNVTRDLFGLEIDVTQLLPSDPERYGFDNIAEMLRTDPSLMNRYLAAAWKVTSAAIGDTSAAPSVQTYRIPVLRSQDGRMEGLPIGTRGGILIEYDFPVDGEYIVKPKLSRTVNNITKGLEIPHTLELTLDGERVWLNEIGGPEEEFINVRDTGPSGDAIDARLETRLQLSAGKHQIGVAFLQKSQAVAPDVIQPFFRELDDSHMFRLPELDSVLVEGPFNVTGPGNSSSRQRVFTCHPDNGSDEADCAEQIISRLARLAFRRDPTEAETERLLGFYSQARAEGTDFEPAVQASLVYMLVTPQFLFRTEAEPPDMEPGTVYAISDLELATRLSFFLWASIPDEELLNLASSGQLGEPAVLEQQVRRMLEDPRASALASNFAQQWLFLRNIDNLRPDNVVFPEFDDTLREAFLRETELLIESVVRDDRPVTELLTANYTFLNERLAKHYGIGEVYGEQFRRVSLDGEPRIGGLLGHGSVLLVSSYPNRTSPVIRGKYVLTNILGTEPPPPPPDVPALEETPGEGLTMRERLALHRADVACAGCHELMDPVGIALENYDAIGRFREHDDAGPVDANVGTIHVLRHYGPIDGLGDLLESIVVEPERFLQTVTEKLTIYALGRGLSPYDMPMIRGILDGAAQNDYRFSAFVDGIVASPAFRMRRAATAEEAGEVIARNSVSGSLDRPEAAIN